MLWHNHSFWENLASDVKVTFPSLGIYPKPWHVKTQTSLWLFWINHERHCHSPTGCTYLYYLSTVKAKRKASKYCPACGPCPSCLRCLPVTRGAGPWGWHPDARSPGVAYPWQCWQESSSLSLRTGWLSGEDQGVWSDRCCRLPSADAQCTAGWPLRHSLIPTRNQMVLRLFPFSSPETSEHHSDLSSSTVHLFPISVFHAFF